MFRSQQINMNLVKVVNIKSGIYQFSGLPRLTSNLFYCYVTWPQSVALLLLFLNPDENHLKATTTCTWRFIAGHETPEVAFCMHHPFIPDLEESKRSSQVRFI